VRKKINSYFRQHAYGLEELRNGLEEAPVQISQYLHILVREGQAEKVKVTFKADAVECLEELMEESHLKHLQAQGIDLEAIKSKVRSNGYRPMELFTQDLGNKSIRVYIE